MNNEQRKKLSPISCVLIVCLVINTFVVLINPNNQDIVKKAKADAGSLHLFWTGGSAPSGWDIVSDEPGEDFYENFIKGAASYGGTGGSETHTHTVTTNVTPGATPRNARAGVTTHSIYGHTHTVATNVSSESNLPSYKQIKVIKPTAGGVPSTIPSGAVAIFDDTPPSGWTQINTYNGLFLRCRDDASSTGGSATHTHDVTTTLSYTSQTRVGVNGRGSTLAKYDHTHTLESSPYETSEESSWPEFVDVILASKDSDGPPSIGMIGFFDDELSYGWTSVSTPGESLDGKYIRANASVGGSGGSNTHSHDDSGNLLSTACTSWDETGTGSGGAFGAHKENISFTNFQTVSNEPPYIEVIFAKRTEVYKPESNNWRWYADEEDETPGTAYAVENTSPPQIEMGKSIGFKLRINFDEVEGVAGNNSRKKIQYSTSTDGPWTEVGSTTDTDKLFRYYDGGGSDNSTLSSVLITGSSSTYKGIYNESNSGSPSNSDHPADTIVEFEYCIENYNAAVDTTYYFSFDDELSGQVPLVSGKSYPNLTTASVYDLSVEAPSSVDMGSWSLGDPPSYKYNFESGEEITMRDNRGQTSGNSLGWTLSAEITTELQCVADLPVISDPVYDGPSGQDDMTINGESYFTGSTTTYYWVEIDGFAKVDTFKWSDDGGSTWDGEGIPCFTGISLNNGVIIDFGADVGHGVGDYWTFTATPGTFYTIFDDDMSISPGTIGSLYDASTSGVSGVGGGLGSQVTVVSASGSGKQGLGGFTILPSLNILDAQYVGEYSGIIAFTLI